MSLGTDNKKLAPLCRYCGRELKKKTEAHSFGQDPAHFDHRFGGSIRHPEKPAGKAEAQRFMNQKILTVRMAKDRETGEPFVQQAITWDGETYQDKFFCTNGCAERMGRAILATSPDWSTGAYREALAAQQMKQGVKTE